jgi:DNA polymerase III gamma/tau subunit
VTGVQTCALPIYALLKVIEEPPPQVIFIMCTTEPGKVKETIQTRCTCLRFNSLTTQEIAGELRRIAKAEGLAVPDEVVQMVASDSKGSLRMAIKNLDHLQSVGEQITPEMATRNLGVASKKQVRDFVLSVAGRKFLDGLRASSASITEGVSPEDFMSLVAEFCHDMLVCQSTGYDMESYGYLKEEVQAIKQAREAVDKVVKGENSTRSSMRLLTKWIDTANSACELVVYKVQPQYQVDVLWVAMLDDLCRAKAGTL